MAKLNGPLEIAGKLKDISIYKSRTSDKMIVRTKGGATKEQIRRDPAFAITRSINSEWSGATQLGSIVRNSFYSLAEMSDYVLVGSINAITNQMQRDDAEHPRGQRSFRLSAHKTLFNGFSFNRKFPFDGVVLSSIESRIDRAAGVATVVIPPLLTNIQLRPFCKLPYFRFVVTFGGVSDLEYSPLHQKYIPVEPHYATVGKFAFTEWALVCNNLPEQTVTIDLEVAEHPITDPVTLILGIGIQFGTIGPDGKPDMVKYAGCGKILLLK